jgi:hypothetical protein
MLITARVRWSLLAGGFVTVLLGSAPQSTAEAAAKKVVPYRAVDARLEVVNSGKATLSDGSTWEGESTEVWTGVKSDTAALITGTRVMQLAVDSRYIRTGFEIQTEPTGSTDDCSGPLEVAGPLAFPILASIEKRKKGFLALWRIIPIQHSDDCGISYNSDLPQGNLYGVKEKEELGDRKLVLEVRVSETYTGEGEVPFSHTMTATGKVVLKRGAAVAG